MEKRRIAVTTACANHLPPVPPTIMETSNSINPCSSWEVYALKSEIESLECVVEAKEAELALMRKQLVDTNKVLERVAAAHDLEKRRTKHPPTDTEEQTDHHRLEVSNYSVPSRVKNEPNPSRTSRLLESFASCSMEKLESMFGELERVLRVTNLDELRSCIGLLKKREKQYSELFEGLCDHMRLRSHEETHASLMHRLQPLPVRNSNQNGIAWSLPSK